MATLEVVIESDSELVPKNDPRSTIISIDPERMGGTPCFVGTRLPIKTLFDRLESDEALREFMDDFEGVAAETCVRVIRMAYERLLAGLPDGKWRP